jgi:hypothetical protein
MTAINFDEPSNGAVNNNNTVALNIRARGEGSHAIWGETEHTTKGGAGVVGISRVWVGVHGIAKGDAHGVIGESTGEFAKGKVGVIGISKNSNGVHGIAKGEGHGVVGETTGEFAKSGAGVVGTSKNWVGVHGIAKGEGHGVIGETTGEFAKGGAGVIGKSANWVGVLGQGPTAGRFEGNVEVTGDIKLVNADCAEDFNISDSELNGIEAGTVMILTENGSLQSSYQQYDKKVAGIVSGASGYKPAIVLDRQDQSQNQKNKERLPIALMGKVYCKVDARHSSIEIGDLLTTSSTKGYAMKAEDPMKAFGAVIGKALAPIKDGMGMIPVLAALQ